MGWGLVITTIINLNFARFLNIWIVTSLVNCSRTESKISRNMQQVMWFSGLRGAMAYALALKSVTDLKIGPVILIDTLIYAFITILGIGSILNPVLERLGVKRTEADRADELNNNDDDLTSPAQARREHSCAHKMKSRVRKFDNEYFSPLFIK